jgi:hypothetical protein
MISWPNDNDVTSLMMLMDDEFHVSCDASNNTDGYNMWMERERKNRQTDRRIGSNLEKCQSKMNNGRV